ncbi:sigma-70 family RNA polymerase sigma factor [Pirellulaceae bacterium]|jgi:RNA polymerase sigma-70 factor (ECF subfamily)|nr:sigma-70 family RNA polymerase sigma factor [Pirellulaceae bacterium]
MGLSEFDRDLLDKCLKNEPGSWEQFIDRFAGLLIGVVSHVAHSRDIRTTIMDREDIVAKVFTDIVDDDFRVLRNFRGTSSLYTYLTIITRRIGVRQLIKLDRKQRKERVTAKTEVDFEAPIDVEGDDFDDMLATLDEKSAQLVRMRYVQELPYSEIAKRLEIPENSIGPMLSRARTQIRESLSENEK